MLHRIQAVKDFSDVKTGDLGGFVEKEENLSHKGTCWIYDNAEIYGEAQVCDHAKVYSEARVFDEARVYGKALIYNEAQVYGKAQVYGEAYVYDEARVYGETRVFGEAQVSNDANIFDQYHILCIPNIGSRKDTTTFFNTKSGKIYVVCVCFRGTIEEFEKAVEKTHGDNKHGLDYKEVIRAAKAILS